MSQNGWAWPEPKHDDDPFAFSVPPYPYADSSSFHSPSAGFHSAPSASGQNYAQNTFPLAGTTQQPQAHVIAQAQSATYDQSNAGGASQFQQWQAYPQSFPPPAPQSYPPRDTPSFLPAPIAPPAQPAPPPKAQSHPAQISRSQPPPPQYSKPLSLQTSFDAPMFQSLPSPQFGSQSQSQSQSQGSSQASFQSTQVQWSHSPSSVSAQLPRKASIPQRSPQMLRPSPQMRQRPSPQLQASVSPQLQQLQQRPSPQLQQRQSPQVQHRPSPQVQHRLSPQQQQRPSPQMQHQRSPQLQQQFTSPQMPLQPSPQLQQLIPPQQATGQHGQVSPQPPQAYLPSQAQHQQSFDFQQFLPPLPPPQQQQSQSMQQQQPQQRLPPPQQQQQQSYQLPVPKFDLAEWERALKESPAPMPSLAPPPPTQQQRSAQPSHQYSRPSQQPNHPAFPQQYGGHDGLGGHVQHALTTPSADPSQNQTIKSAAHAPNTHTPTIAPSFAAQPIPSPSQNAFASLNVTQSSSTTSQPHPHPIPMPKSSSASQRSTPRPSSTPTSSVPAKRKSQASQPKPRTPQPPPPPSHLPAHPPTSTTPAGRAVPSQVPTPSPAPAPLPDAIPTGPLLFHAAVSAHHSATYHLQQVFVPQHVQDGDKGGMKRQTPSGDVLFTHDSGALNTALRLLVMALDLLRTGFYLPNLSDSERAAFGLEFATVAAKVLATEEPVKKMLSKEELARVHLIIDHKRLASDVEDVMTKTLAAARSPHLKHYRQGVELVSARLAFMKDKANHAKRIIKHALASTPREDVAHRYNLHLLHMNHLLKAGNVELLQVVKEFEADAEAQGHQDVVLLARIIRIRAHFSLRRWDNLLTTLDESEALFGTDEVHTSGEPATSSFRLVLLMHFLNMRALHYGRAGDDVNAKKQLSRLYPLMDAAIDKGKLAEMRKSGGVVNIPLRTPGGLTQHILVQSTPVNVLWALTYLTSVVSRRDLLGTVEQCRTLNHTRAMRQYEDFARPDDLWDSGFSFRHGVADALELRHKINKIRAEMLMEEALAFVCRSSFEQVKPIMTKTVSILHDNNLFLTHSHQLALLYGHIMHSIGLPDQAVRYYRAAQSLLVAGSEMRLIVDINLMAVQGGFSNLHSDLDRATKVNVMADQCRAGTNGALNAVGFFLLSLTDHERVSSKRKLTFAYEVCRRGKLNVLYALIFAFTTAQHLFGDRDRQLKQLESGRDIARLLGGKDRADGCGLLPLGLWYNTKLRDHYRLDSRFDDEKAVAADIERHLKRIKQVHAYGLAQFPPRVV